MDAQRLVRVRGADGTPGSGLAIGGRLVLTSAHVMDAVGAAVTVRRVADARDYPGTVVWAGTPGGRDDAALVVVDWPEPAGRPVRWGRTITLRPGIPCAAWGFPDVVQRDGRAAETLQPSGTLNPGDRYVGDRYVMNIDQRVDGAAPWGGMSGAALVSGDLVLGVIAADPAGRAHTALEAVPAYVLARDLEFRRVVAEHTGGPPHLEPVELRGLAEPPPPPTASPAGLLVAARGVVPFRGREELLDHLLTWADQPGFSARLVHGPGGQGKTRLAHRLGDHLTDQRWAVVWLRPDADPRALADAAVPLLVVVDYAEARAEQVAALLRALSERTQDTPVKLVMLARTAGDWWAELPTASDIVAEMLTGARVIELLALEPDDEAYREAVTAFAAALPGEGWHDIAADLTPPVADPGNALALHMTALADLLDAASGDVVVGGGEVVGGEVEDRLLTHERRYWTRTADRLGVSTAGLADALAAAVLLGAHDRAAADDLLRRVPRLSDKDTDTRWSVREWIAALYPPTTADAPWGELAPDRLAEHFIGRHLLAHPGLADHLLPGASADQLTRLLTVTGRASAHLDDLEPVLIRLCVRHGDLLAQPAIEVAPRLELPRPLVAALCQIADAPELPIETLSALTFAVPHESHTLVEFATVANGRLAEHYRDQLARGAETAAPQLIGTLNNLSLNLADLGHRYEALALSREAVDVCRRHANSLTDPLLSLSASLSNLSVRLSDVGRSDEALATITEAVAVDRGLAAERPASFREHLATHLHNLAHELSDVGRYDEALTAITEALAIDRERVAEHPEGRLADLAHKLTSLAGLLIDMERHDEAMTASIESVEIYQRLAVDHSDTHYASFANALRYYSVLLGLLGHHDEALSASTYTLAIYQLLAAERPSAYRAKLAYSLNNIGMTLGKLDRDEESLAAATEAADILRELAAEHPDAHLLDFATVLKNLAAQLGAMGHIDEALTTITETVEICRAHVAQRPTAFRPELAKSLFVQAVELLESDREPEALASAAEAVAMFEQLDAERPGTNDQTFTAARELLTYLHDSAADRASPT